MTAPFTSLDSALDVASIVVVNEMLNAFMERCLAVDPAYHSAATVGGRYYDPVTAGTDAHLASGSFSLSFAYPNFSWRVFQQMVEAMGVQYVDHTLPDTYSSSSSSHNSSSSKSSSKSSSSGSSISSASSSQTVSEGSEASSASSSSESSSASSSPTSVSDSSVSSQTESSDTFGDLDGQSDLTLFSLARFRAAADMPLGFRRATSWDPNVDNWKDYYDPMFSYGPAQNGDIFGPWIYLDIRNAISAMRWTRHAMSFTSQDYGGDDEFFIFGDCPASRQAAIDAWVPDWTGTHGYGYLASVRRVNQSFWQRIRSRGTPSYSGLWTGRPHQGDVYSFPSTISGQWIDGNLHLGTSFYDIDGIGFAGGGMILRTQSMATTTSASGTGNTMGDIETCPIELSPLVCNGFTNEEIAEISVTWKLLSKWDFTTSN